MKNKLIKYHFQFLLDTHGDDPKRAITLTSIYHKISEHEVLDICKKEYEDAKVLKKGHKKYEKI